MTEKAEAGLTPISVVVTDAVIRVEPGTSVVDVARAMADASVGLLVVGHGDDVVGVVSERDVVSSLANGRDPSTTTAGAAHQPPSTTTLTPLT